MSDQGGLPHDRVLDLLALRQKASDLCDAAASRDFVGAAINWADLKCYHAEWFQGDDGEAGYRIYIDEAAPDNSEFQDWIASELATAGWCDVDVVTEW